MQKPFPPPPLSESFSPILECVAIFRACPFSPVSNEVPEDPVLSPVSSHVFERRLVAQYIDENGTDPINGEPLSVDQLLEIKGEQAAMEMGGREWRCE